MDFLCDMHGKVLIDDLLQRTEKSESEQTGFQADLFADFLTGW